MRDGFGREINYLRLSVTDRCNLRCVYCHDGFFEKFPRKAVLRTEEINFLLSYLKNRGLKKVKITGGEPLLRADIGNIVKNAVSLKLKVSLTTNGVLLARKAQELYDSGLRRINFGIDCLDDNLFNRITGQNKFKAVMSGLRKAKEVGFSPIKVNVVLIKGLNHNVAPWLEFLRKEELVVRFIEVMPFVNGYQPVTSTELKSRLREMGKLIPCKVEGDGPAQYYRLKGLKGKIGLITPLSNSFCENCNRLRINALGMFRSCLFKEETFDFLSLVRNGYSKRKLDELVDQVLLNKPESSKGLIPKENMCQIGG